MFLTKQGKTKSKIGTAVIFIQSILILLMLVYSFVQQGIAQGSQILAIKNAEEAQKMALEASRIREELDDCRQTSKK
jgi:hypothetical protein